jgi:two-component sensor histidine kinase
MLPRRQSSVANTQFHTDQWQMWTAESEQFSSYKHREGHEFGEQFCSDSPQEVVHACRNKRYGMGRDRVIAGSAMFQPFEASGKSPDFTGFPAVRDELPYRLRQQSLLGEFGRSALQTRDLKQILQRATELCAVGLESPFAKVLEYIPEEQRLLMRAGCGWDVGAIDNIAHGANRESPAGYAYHINHGIISNNLRQELRFEIPELLRDHGIRRVINVLIAAGGAGDRPFGILEVDSPDSGQFDHADADFLTGFAGLLGIAIERQQADAKLAEAVEYQDLLSREMSHRVKNSLASVIGLLHVQARAAHSVDIRNALKDAGSRVAAIAMVHDQLWRGSRIGFIDLADFMNQLCEQLGNNAEGLVLNCHADPMLVSADHAIPLGLLINEFVTNAVKYAYPGGFGVIEVSAHEIDGCLHVGISDCGVGLPQDFEIDKPRTSLGFKVITGLLRQLHGHIGITRNEPSGARFLLELPILSEVAGGDPADAIAKRDQSTPI